MAAIGRVVVSAGAAALSSPRSQWHRAQMTRTALVTGANRGIGLAIAHGLAQAGLHVLVGARRAADADDAARAIAGAVGVVVDVADAATAAAAARAIVAEHGPVDVLVNNAGVCPSGDLDDVDVDTVVAAMHTNALGPVALMQVCGQGMKARGYGRIVNVSSGWGSFSEGLGGPIAYAISKAALNASTVSAARALGPSVKVNAMCPGWVRTRMGGQGAHRSVEEGADTAIWLATLDDNGPTAGFFRERQPIRW